MVWCMEEIGVACVLGDIGHDWVRLIMFCAMCVCNACFASVTDFR
jgi:hypothetical protein